jgi:hypothetical protein
LAVARAEYPVWLWLAGPSFSSRFITGAYDIAINMPFALSLILKDLSEEFTLCFWIPGGFLQEFSKNM